ncbi:MAG: PfkB family carbohydrate kinase, partial [Planctomycetota bacterium]|nr:PfkB family carbohydrate kinase [Planctomycetota bacterium]
MPEGHTNTTGEPPLVLSYGELVVDRVAGHDRPGGAPLNFAAAIQPLLGTVGGDCLVASRVGQDDGGALLQEAMRAHNLSQALLQSTTEHPTGLSLAEVKSQGDVAFHLEPGAWDEIAYSEALREQAAACVGLLAGS